MLFNSRRELTKVLKYQLQVPIINVLPNKICFWVFYAYFAYNNVEIMLTLIFETQKRNSTMAKLFGMLICHLITKTIVFLKHVIQHYTSFFRLLPQFKMSGCQHCLTTSFKKRILVTGGAGFMWVYKIFCRNFFSLSFPLTKWWDAGYKYALRI